MENSHEFWEHFMFVAEKNLQSVDIAVVAFQDIVAFSDYVSQAYSESKLV